MNKKVNIVSLGCAKNLVDSEIVVGGLKSSGIQVVDEPESADIILINTCGFLDQAREESIDTILAAAELKSSGKARQLLVMGCLSERYPDELKKELPEVDRFFGTRDHQNIVAHISGDRHHRDDPLYLRSLLTPRHYAYLKIAEGCDNGCSFCSIPLMRGLQKSRSIDAIVTEAQELANRGVQELLVIAQDTTSYGWDLQPKKYLADLLNELNHVEGVRWIRVHYAHPAHLSRQTIAALAANDKICRYLDIPIQHASDPVLESMRRGLNRDGIRRRLDQLRKAIPDIRLRTTLIVGYPGETDADFQTLYDFVEEQEFDRLGVFTYSEEEGTMAADLPDDVPRQVKDDRKAAIMDLQNGISQSRNQALVGQRMTVIIDENKAGESIGRTEFDSPEIDNIVIVAGELPIGKFADVQITAAGDYHLEAVPV